MYTLKLFYRQKVKSKKLNKAFEVNITESLLKIKKKTCHTQMKLRFEL